MNESICLIFIIKYFLKLFYVLKIAFKHESVVTHHPILLFFYIILSDNIMSFSWGLSEIYVKFSFFILDSW